MTEEHPAIARPEVGLWADHKAGLDSRRVVAVSEDSRHVKLEIFGHVTDWLPARNYTFHDYDRATA